MPSKAKRKAAKRPSRVVKGKPAATKPTLLSGGNPQVEKADGDAPVQAYIAAMPGWKRDVGRRLDALIGRNVPKVRKAVRWNSPFYGVEGQGWFLNFHCFTKYVKVAFFRGSRWSCPTRRVQAQGRALPRYPRGRPARRGADGDVDQAGGRPARLDSVAWAGSDGRGDRSWHPLNIVNDVGICLFLRESRFAARETREVRGELEDLIFLGGGERWQGRGEQGGVE